MDKHAICIIDNKIANDINYITRCLDGTYKINNMECNVNKLGIDVKHELGNFTISICANPYGGYLYYPIFPEGKEISGSIFDIIIGLKELAEAEEKIKNEELLKIYKKFGEYYGVI